MPKSDHAQNDSVKRTPDDSENGASQAPGYRHEVRGNRGALHLLAILWLGALHQYVAIGFLRAGSCPSSYRAPSGVSVARPISQCKFHRDASPAPSAVLLSLAVSCMIKLILVTGSLAAAAGCFALACSAGSTGGGMVAVGYVILGICALVTAWYVKRHC